MSKNSKRRRKERRAKMFEVPNTPTFNEKEGVEILKKASAPTTQAFKRKYIPPCHSLTEIYENLWIGAMKDAFKMGDFCDILVPLDSVDGDIWLNFDGEIHYWPVVDMSVLPERILNRAVNDIIDCLSHGKKVGVFCIGGHGRTGYITACVLGKLGIEDPIGYLREHYCSKAVETYSQAKEIGKFIGNNELADKYFPYGDDLYYGFGYGYGSLYDYYYGGHSLFGKAQPVQELTHVDMESNTFIKEVLNECEEEFTEDFTKVNDFLINHG